MQGERGAGIASAIQLLSVPGTVLRGCGSGLPGNGVLPIVDGRGVGSCLGRVTTVYKVRGALACRMTHRSYTASILLTGNMPVRAMSGVLNRAGVQAARVCTEVASLGMDNSVRVLTRGLSIPGHATDHWGHIVIEWRRNIVYNARVYFPYHGAP